MLVEKLRIEIALGQEWQERRTQRHGPFKGTSRRIKVFRMDYLNGIVYVSADVVGDPTVGRPSKLTLDTLISHWRRVVPPLAPQGMWRRSRMWPFKRHKSNTESMPPASPELSTTDRLKIAVARFQGNPSDAYKIEISLNNTQLCAFLNGWENLRGHVEFMRQQGPPPSWWSPGVVPARLEAETGDILMAQFYWTFKAITQAAVPLWHDPLAESMVDPPSAPT